MTVALALEIGFVFGFPLALGAWLRRRYQVSWLLFAAGAITFGLSQAVHLPLNQALFAFIGRVDPFPHWATALVLGLTAGICEETVRYAALRWVLRDLRKWRQALMFGAGHGGIEAIVFVGLVVGAVLLNMTTLQGADLNEWTLPAGQAAQLRDQLDAYWGQAWVGPLLAAAERLFSIVFHIGMAVLVLRAVRRSQPAYLLLAMGLHTASNTLALLAVDAGWSLVATEGVVGLFALAGLGIVLASRPGELAEEARPQVTTSGSGLPPLPGARRQPCTPEERLRRQVQESKYER